ncbi:MAG: N-acetylmuramoyl-L-alanine amidase [Tyzzerella sp.]|nr:N-acetylmuramoyl-L-alanine amidase [Tyzzerella sp.]
MDEQRKKRSVVPNQKMKLILCFLTITCFLFTGCAKQTVSGGKVENGTASQMGELAQKETQAVIDKIAKEKAEAEAAKKAKEEAEAQAEKEQASAGPQVPKVEAIPGQHRDPNSAVVVIDPGHQLRGDSAKEPNGPGSSTMKARVTSGATGVATKVAEYVMNLNVSLKLKTELENRGYTVYMTRYTHDVNISNKERAEYATSVEADIAVRIHGNGSSNSSVRGAETYAPSAKNPYVSHLSKASISLSRCIIDAYCQATGFKNRGVLTSDTMTGINWSTVPVTIIELGYMSNAQEDRMMQDETIQNNMVQGIANGIDKYFGF